MVSGPPDQTPSFISPTVLTNRALNRALLERQLLLRRRADVSVAEAIELLVGLQAQAPMPPYYGLWSRLDDFDPRELGRLLTDRGVVRLTLMRGTVHLVSVRDALLLRPLVQEAIERGYNAAFRRRMVGVDLAELATVARGLVESSGASQNPAAARTARQIAAELIERGLGHDLEAMTNAVRVYLPLVQLPPRGVWGASGQAKYATLESWTGRPMVSDPSIGAVLLRYLAAFGPATVMDAQTWSGLTKLGPEFERLRAELATFIDEDGRELFDLPDAPRPNPDVPAPVRLLGEFDNVLLSHANRERIVPQGVSPWMDSIAGSRHVNTLLLDGMLRGRWWIERAGSSAATLAIHPIAKLTGAERIDVEAEATRMLAFAAADTDTRRVRFEGGP